MLKIRKKNGQTLLEFQKKTWKFNQNLFFACSIAFVLHFLAYLIFYIAPFKILNDSTFPPSIVEADLSNLKFDAVVQIDALKLKFPLAPTFSEPEFPSNGDLEKEFALNDANFQIDFFHSPFLEMERKGQYKTFFEKNDEKKSVFKFQVTGDLAKINFNKSVFKQDVKTLLKSFRKIYARYDVKVENRTGKIFWVELKSGVLTFKQNEMIKKMFKELVFEPSSGFVTTGEIEIILNERV